MAFPLDMEINMTLNETEADVKHDIWPMPLGVFVFVFMTITIVLNLLLNSLMLVALRRANGIKHSTKVFLASLTVSDLLTGVTEAILLPQLYTGRWLMGDFLCKAFVLLTYDFYYISIVSILLLTIDRFVAISYPLRYPRLITTRRSKITVCSCWTTIIVLFTTAFGINCECVFSHEICWNRKFDWRIYIPGISSVVILVTILILYLRIYLIAQRHAGDTTTLGQSEGKPVNSGQINTRAIVTIIIIIGTLIVTWIPTAVYNLTASTNGWDFKTIKLLDVLLLSNSWLNVVIYYLRNQNVRQALRGLLLSKPKCRCLLQS